MEDEKDEEDRGMRKTGKMDEVMKRVLGRGFGHAPSPSPPPAGKPLVMSRAEYGAMFGPTTGDKVVLGGFSHAGDYAAAAVIRWTEAA